MSITIKTEADINILREGGQILARLLDELEKIVEPGTTALDIDDRAMELIDQHGLEPMTLGYHPHFAPRPYPAASCVSVNQVIVHGIPNEEKIVFKEGDIVSIDVVIGYKGLVVDSARTVGVGQLRKEVQGLLQATHTALSVGIDAAQPGKHVGDIGRAIEKSVPKTYGIIDSFCGHGVGYSLHEEPNIPNVATRDKGSVLEPGMVLAIEPMLTLGSSDVRVLEDGYTAVTADGSWAAHMEHSIVITTSGPEILTL